ncbi:alkaline phosphatase family protein [Patescibacteria group bacterium]|nr:alkaline phosphatase family protein [Patescibacteria group bacterium]
MMRKIVVFIVVLALTSVGIRYYVSLPKSSNSTLKLYWFIPDGMRAEPYLFNIYEWAREGKLPNIKKLMDRGSYGYSYPNFPSHTPTNFAALLTGTYPEVNGVDDGPMRAIGKPLDAVAVPGFRSTAKKVPPIWKTLEDAGMKVAVISVPGSTPPEINKGVVLRGRWGGWGADFAAINFETKGDLSQRIKQGRAVHLFFFGPELTQYLDPVSPSGWYRAPKSYSPPEEVTLTGWGTPVYAYIYDSTNDKKTNYDRVAFSLDKKSVFGDIQPGEWSAWQPIVLQWKTSEQTIPVNSDVKATVIKLGPDGFFRIRLFYNNLNRYIAFPPEAADIMNAYAGPMVDFADNFPAQLIYYPEDKRTFEQEATMSFAWHTKAVSGIVQKFHPNAVIHDIYTPNQMLTSKWWMGAIDPSSAAYNSTPPKTREELWNEVKDMYGELDTMIGAIIQNAGPDTYIVLSSDHGAVPLNIDVRLNNLFARKGWLKFTINPKTGEPIIDWNNSKVIYLKMAHVYINPNGLAGNYERASGPAYITLRNEVRQTLAELTDPDTGQKPVVDIVNWENAKAYLQMDPDRAGDLIIANAPGYGWNEEMTSDLTVFSKPSVTGYKQAILSKDVPGMWTPFIIAGPGIKKGNFLGNKPFTLIDQYPTIMKALRVAIPGFVQGKALNVFE